MWLKDPAISEPESIGIELHQEFGFVDTFPPEEGALRISTKWVDTEYGTLPVDEDWVFNQTISSMQWKSLKIEDWLEAN